MSLPHQNIDTSFERYFNKLVLFKKIYGHCHITCRSHASSHLKIWVKQQRLLYRKNLLHPEQIHKLESIGFAWKEKGLAWEIHYQDLLAYKKEQGNCNISPSYSDTLYKWIKQQRLLYQKKLLSKEKAQQLEEIGALIKRQKSLWEDQYQALITFKNEYGHCRVPSNYLVSPKLSAWVKTQRHLYHKGRLQLERLHRLNEIEFPWKSIKQTSWELHANSLKQFFNKHHHCKIPENYTPDPQLKSWIYTQRYARQKGKLSLEKVKFLDGLGFEWQSKVNDQAWESSYNLLLQFTKIYGHCNVPFNYKTNPTLGHWVAAQRHFYHKKQLSKTRVQRLKMLGFEWRLQTHFPFEELLKKLKNFKKRYGHCNVPHYYSTDPSLGHWASNLKQAYRKGKLLPEKIAQLEKLGFKWQIYLT